SLAHRYWLVVWGRVFDAGQTGQRPVSTQLLNCWWCWAGSSTRARRVKDPSPHSYLIRWWCWAGSSTRARRVKDPSPHSYLICWWCGPGLRPGQTGQRPVSTQLLMPFLAESLDLNVNARGQIELHQSIDRLRRGLQDVEQALVRANLELLARLLIDVRRTQHTILVLHRGQRNGASNLGTRAPRGFDDLARGLVQDAIVVRFQPDS